MQAKKLIVVGGGAAGFFCAIHAKANYPALKVVLLEKHNKVLQKVKVSGGGRCNVTHAVDSIPQLLTHYPRGKNFLKKVFYQFGPIETIQWFEQHGVTLKTESDGRMFPITNTSQTIIDCLEKEAFRLGVEVVLQQSVDAIQKVGDIFKIQTNQGEITSDFMCIACGGFAKGWQFDWITALGHTIEKPVPSLFTFNLYENGDLKALQGVSLEKATIRIPKLKTEETGPLLITHWGLSGPVVLRLSAWQARKMYDAEYNFIIQLNWINTKEESLRLDWNDIRTKMGDADLSKNPFELPKRLWAYLLAKAELNESKKWSELKSKEQNKLIAILCAQALEVRGKTTFKEEFVTCGGIHLNEIDPKTMQSRVVPHLFFAGEIINVDGITGGFNFQNAWSTAAIAARLGVSHDE